MIKYGNCQTSYYYPIQVAQYSSYFNFINPAVACNESNIEVYAVTKNFLNYFSNFASYYSGVNLAITNKEKNSYSTAGFKFNTENEGKYISRTRMYIMYSYHTSIIEKWKLSAGIDLGLANFSIKSTPNIGGKSEFAADANVGIFLSNKTLELGLSINQIFNGKFQPYQEISILKRHYNFYCGTKIFINQDLYLKPQFLIRLPSYLSYNADYSLETFWKMFLIGLSYRYKQGGAIWLGVKNYKIGKENISFTVCYNTPLRKSIININSLEFAIKLNFIKN